MQSPCIPVSPGWGFFTFRLHWPGQVPAPRMLALALAGEGPAPCELLTPVQGSLENACPPQRSRKCHHKPRLAEARREEDEARSGSHTAKAPSADKALMQLCTHRGQPASGAEEVWTWTFQLRYPYPDRLLQGESATHSHLEGKRLQLGSDFLL